MRFVYKFLFILTFVFVALTLIQCQKSFDTILPHSESQVSFSFNFQQQAGENTISSGQQSQFIGKIYIEVNAPDMEKIVRNVNVSSNQVNVKLTIPQGKGRDFLIIAKDNSNVSWFRADTTLDILSDKMNFSIEMRPTFRVTLYKVDDGSSDGGWWFESPDTLALNLFESPYQNNKLIHILLYINQDDGNDGNYRLVVTDTLGTLIWRSAPTQYLGEGQWIDWKIIDDVRLPQVFLIGIQYTGNGQVLFPNIGVDTDNPGFSLAYVISSQEFLYFPYGAFMIRAAVATPTGTRKILSARAPHHLKNLKSLPLKTK